VKELLLALEYNLPMVPRAYAQIETRPRATVEELATTVRRLQPLFPDIDPGDLDLILTSLLRPFGSGRRFFLREVRPGVRVF